MKAKLSLLKYHKDELTALGLFIIGGTLGMLGLIQRIPLVLGIVGIVILSKKLCQILCKIKVKAKQNAIMAPFKFRLNPIDFKP